MWWAMVAAMAATGVGDANPPPAVMEPASKWIVDYGENGCLMARVYGTGKDEVIVGWRALPLDDTMQMLVQRRGGGTGLRRGMATVSVAPGISDENPYDSFPMQGNAGRRTTVWLKAAQFADLPERATLTIALSGSAPLAVALVKPQKAFATLATCNDETLKRWGIDPAERARIATPADTGDLGRWFGPLTYPEEAIRRGMLGRVAVLYAIGVDGRVSDCRVVIRSGSDDLDRAACAAIGRVRAKPAIGHDGQPVASHQVTSINWELPGAWQDDAAFRAHRARWRREYREKRAAD